MRAEITVWKSKHAPSLGRKVKLSTLILNSDHDILSNGGGRQASKNNPSRRYKVLQEKKQQMFECVF